MIRKTVVDIAFEDGTVHSYDCDLSITGQYGYAVKRAIVSLFNRVKNGRFSSGPYDHRRHPYREPGPKATHIIRIVEIDE